MLRSRHTVPLLILTLIIGGATVAVALAIDWIPVQAAEQAERTDTLLWFVVWASVVIFTLVTVVIIYCAWRFRAKPGDDSDGPPIHGNTKLEIVWTVVPAVLLAVMAVWAYLVLADNEALASDRLVVEVTAEQFTWEFVNREAGIASGDMRVPVGRQVELEMRSQDVIHDFYVKEFRVKLDIVPGITTRLVFNPDRPGTYQVVCAELCGVGHGLMRARVIVMEPADYEAWLAQARAQVARQPQPGQAPAGGAAAPATTAPAQGTTAPAQP
ncbi:MAG TPA: cytochrome c oxidase subunit II [Miltoncostaeaceae bacterium]|nr:cytochrome c oxidase subunit II [Miltoncostaeaceae bacterium]